MLSFLYCPLVMEDGSRVRAGPAAIVLYRVQLSSIAEVFVSSSLPSF